MPYLGHAERIGTFGGGHMLGGGLFGGLLVFLFLALLVALVIWLIVRRPVGTAQAAIPGGMSQPTPLKTDDALRIVRERLARGEIDAEQYRTIMEALNT